MCKTTLKIGKIIEQSRVTQACFAVLVFGLLLAAGVSYSNKQFYAGQIAAGNEPPEPPANNNPAPLLSPAAQPIDRTKYKSLPSLAPGQTFVYMGSAFSAPPQPLLDAATRRPITLDQFGLRILTLLKTAQKTNGTRLLTFSVEGSKRRVTLQTDAGVGSLPGIVALLHDDKCDALRRNYEGRQVWCYGHGSSSGLTDNADYAISKEEWSVSTPVRIRHILRLDADNVSTAANEPLLVVLNQRYAVYKTADFYIIRPKYRRSRIVARLSSGYQLFAGTADFERLYSLKSPHIQHPEWSRSVLHQLDGEDTLLGMTHDMLAWTMGWPDDSGSLDQLRAMPQWDYHTDNPKPYIVTFDRSGRVSDVDWGGPDGCGYNTLRE